MLKKRAEQIGYKDSQYLFFSSYVFFAYEYFMWARTCLFSVDEHLVDMYVELQVWCWKSSPTILPFYSLKQGLLINPKLTNRVSLSWQLAHGDHTTLTSETRVTYGLPKTCTVYGSCEDQNSILRFARQVL